MFYDTSAFVDYLRGVPTVESYFEQVGSSSEGAYCSVITETELWAGIRTDLDQLRVTEVLSRFNIVPVTSNVARLAGSLLRSVGDKKAHFGDALIAATAMLARETVLTADRRSENVFGSQSDYLVYR